MRYTLTCDCGAVVESTTSLAEGATFTCSKCNSGVGKRRRTITLRAIACREHPLPEREPELYKRLDEMSQAPLDKCWQLWGVDGVDGLCVEIGAEASYEHLPVFLEILKEGKWRTQAFDVRAWLRENLARRVRRSGALEDYDATGKRRIGGPKFDKRNGALTAFATRPFVEFEVLSQNGDTISAEEVIERKRLQTAWDDDGYQGVVMPADGESLRFLGRRTLAEVCEASCCAQLADALKNDRPTFDKALTRAINNQQWLTRQMGLDQDEAEVLAVIELLWDLGPRMYLNFLDEANKRRIRNAWDRLDRKIKKPEWATLFRHALRESSDEIGTALGADL